MIKFNSVKFIKKLNNAVGYSSGFLEGVNRGKAAFLNSLGTETIKVMKEYIDSNARVNPEMLHHVYEWNRTGSPSARLYDIAYTVSNLGLSFSSSFSQSKSIKDGSTEPFYNKAFIMENGIPVVIKPKKAQALAFTVDDEEVFTSNPVLVTNPGGDAAVKGFEKVFDIFFSQYFSQAFLQSSGILRYLESPVLYKKNFAAGVRGGKQVGIKTGYKWIANAAYGKG